ncbi:hypothetical protein FOL46_006968 [Perkinsus olseni]|nr:hypothetical protein FOL46_006968 [Perkinsus olseni]
MPSMRLYLVTVCFLDSSSAGSTTLGEATIISKVVPRRVAVPPYSSLVERKGWSVTSLRADALNSTMMDSLFLGVPSVSNLKARDTLTLSLDQLVKFSQKDGLLSVTEMVCPFDPNDKQSKSVEAGTMAYIFPHHWTNFRLKFPHWRLVRAKGTRYSIRLSNGSGDLTTAVRLLYIGLLGEKAVDDEGLSLKFTQEEPVQEESGTWNSVVSLQEFILRRLCRMYRNEYTSLPTIVVAKKINRAAVMAEDATVLAFPRPSTKKYVPALGIHHAPANRPYGKSFKVISTVIVPRTWMPQYNSVTFCLEGDGRLAICSFSCGGEKTVAVLDYIPIQLPQYKSLDRVTCISYRHAKADTVEAFLDWLYDGITTSSSSSNGRNSGDTSNANTVFVKYFCDRLASNEESSMKFLT